MDVDLLERELYAMRQSTEEFVEISRWVRPWTDGSWMRAHSIRTLRSTIGFYSYVVLVLILFWGLVYWLAG